MLGNLFTGMNPGQVAAQTATQAQQPIGVFGKSQNPFGFLNQNIKPGGMLSNMLNDPTKGMTGGMLGQALPYVAGSQLGSLSSLKLGKPGGIPDAKKDRPWKLGEAPPPSGRVPPPGYRPGYDPEFNYRFPRMGFAHGGLASLSSPQDGQDEVTSRAIAALMGQSDDPQRDLGAFLNKYGEEALRELVSMVEDQRERMTAQPDGLSDSIPATIEGQEPTALSEGEFVVPSDVVSDLGNGSTDAGAKRLLEMMDKVRAARRGTPQQPPAIQPEAMMPA